MKGKGGGDGKGGVMGRERVKGKEGVRRQEMGGRDKEQMKSGGKEERKRVCKGKQHEASRGSHT